MPDQHISSGSSGSELLSPEVMNKLPQREHFLNPQPQSADTNATPSASAGTSDFSGIPSSFGALSSFVAPPALNTKIAENFDNMLAPALIGPDPILSPLSKFSGKAECVNKSFSLSNSTGPLCLDEKTYQLLTTRGGNAGHS